jgi:hypothetical protein
MCCLLNFAYQSISIIFGGTHYSSAYSMFFLSYWLCLLRNGEFRSFPLFTVGATAEEVCMQLTLSSCSSQSM